MAFGTLQALLSLEQAQGQGVGIESHNLSILMEMGWSLHPALALPVLLKSKEHPQHWICLPGKQICHSIFLSGIFSMPFISHLFNVFHQIITTKNTQKNPSLGKGKDKAHNEYTEFRGVILR